jgi:NAD(P)H-flavin reductase
LTDYLHLTKRFGIVAASQLPLHYLLAFKSPFSPIQLLTGCSHETLNIYHQLIGRIIVFLFQLHAVFYLNFFIQSNLLAAKVKELYIICGILGALIFTTIGTTALAPVRRWNYRVFYAIHFTLAMAWMPILYWHVSHIHIYIYETLVLFALNITLRKLHSKTVAATMKILLDTNFIQIEIPITAESAHLRRFAPGQHAYLSLAGHPVWKTTFKSNPFSVASIPSVDGNLRFYARILNGNTAQLAQQASATSLKRQFTIEGPYGVREHSDKLLQCDRILFVAGGVGATFTVPLYRHLLADLSPSRGSYRRQKVLFVWMAKSMADVTWALPDEAKEREGFVERLRVYVTRASPGDDSSGLLREPESEHANAGLTETEEGIELEERQNLLSAESNGSVDPKRKLELAAYAGRPDLKILVDETFSHGNSEKVAVFVCGPKVLNQRVRREVGRWVGRGRDVWFWEETFAL